MSFPLDLKIRGDKFGFNRARAYRQLFDALLAKYEDVKDHHPDITATIAEELGIPESKVIEKLSGGGLPFNDMCDLYVAMGEDPFSNLGLFDFESPILMSPAEFPDANTDM